MDAAAWGSRATNESFAAAQEAERVARARKSTRVQSAPVMRETELLTEARAIVNAGLRQRAKSEHPDCGGTAERMQVVNAAAQWLRDQITRAGVIG